MGKLFVIDDDTIFQFIIKKLLQKSKLFRNATYYNQPITALDYLIKNKGDHEKLPDVIFLDLNMPDFHGWDFVEDFQSLYKSVSKKITIYILTASVLSQDQLKASTYDFIGEIISKPITVEKLLTIHEKTKAIIEHGEQ